MIHRCYRRQDVLSPRRSPTSVPPTPEGAGGSAQRSLQLFSPTPLIGKYACVCLCVLNGDAMEAQFRRNRVLRLEQKTDVHGVRLLPRSARQLGGFEAAPLPL
eukprot:499952-Pyramimonas_sp.AAC.1